MYTLIHNLLPKNKRFSFFFFQNELHIKTENDKTKSLLCRHTHTLNNHSFFPEADFTVFMGVILLHHYHYYHILVVYVPNTIKKRVVCTCVCVLRFSTLKYIFSNIRKQYEKQEQQRQHDNNFLAYFFHFGVSNIHRSISSVGTRSP